MANGVKFGDYHSSIDLSLFLNSKEIGVPQVKDNRISIPAGDGSLDLTEFFGGIKYEDRELNFVFTKIGGDFIDVFSDIQNKIHGRTFNIVLDTDTSYYYRGRVFINSWSSSAATGVIEINCICEPYKYKTSVTVIEDTIGVEGGLVITCSNLRKNATPTIITDGSITVDFGTDSYAINAGTHVMTGIIFVEGNNTITIGGAEGTNISIEYQEGAI